LRPAKRSDFPTPPAGDLHVGLGTAATVDELTITWPDGAVEHHLGLPADQPVTFTHTAGSDP